MDKNTREGFELLVERKSNEKRNDTTLTFCNDILDEIFSYFNDYSFMVMNCALVCKQWLNVISETSTLELTCKPHMKPKGQFLSNISTLLIIERKNSFELFQTLPLMIQLTNLDIHNNNLGPQGAKHISKLSQLTSLDISSNNIGSEGAKYLSELENLTFLNISRNYLHSEGCKYLRGMKKLTQLDARSNYIGLEGCTYISEMKQLKYLMIYYNNYGIEGSNILNGMKQLKFLDMDEYSSEPEESFDSGSDEE